MRSSLLVLSVAIPLSLGLPIISDARRPSLLDTSGSSWEQLFRQQLRTRPCLSWEDSVSVVPLHSTQQRLFSSQKPRSLPTEPSPQPSSILDGMLVVLLLHGQHMVPEITETHGHGASHLFVKSPFHSLHSSASSCLPNLLAGSSLWVDIRKPELSWSNIMVVVTKPLPWLHSSMKRSPRRLLWKRKLLLQPRTRTCSRPKEDDTAHSSPSLLVSLPNGMVWALYHSEY